MLNYAVMDSSIGRLLLVASAKGLCALRWLDREKVDDLLDEVSRQHGAAHVREDAKSLKPLAKQIEAVIAGKLPAWKVPLDLRGTEFQKRVWKELARVPWGKTYSYSELAAKVGAPRAVRAVASACARNPVGIVVPCHRILRKGGGLGGYYWGLDRKRQLLKRELPN